MQLRTFTAPTMTEALAQVKTALGGGAVILHTRTYQRRHWLGLKRHELVEITASVGLDVPERRRSAVRPPITRQIAAYLPPGASANGPTQASHAATLNAAIAAGTAPLAQQRTAPGQGLMQTAAAGNVALLAINDQVKDLASLVRELSTQVRQQQSPNVPEELLEYYGQLTRARVCDDIAAEVIKTVHRQLRPEMYTQAAVVRERIADVIEKMIPTSGPIERTKHVGPHVVALIGPTGVGKTTTIAKLAANLKLRERRRVGLITIDTYRIAAIDQLKKYADIIGSPLKVVASADDLRAAIASMSDCDFVLIDTAGRSPNDALQLSEMKGFIAAAEPDEVHLVLSATASQDCVELAIDRFSDVRCDKLIFTKLDEAAHVGTVLNIVNKTKKNLAYITTGQDVPDKIELGRGRRLAQLILGSSL